MVEREIPTHLRRSCFYISLTCWLLLNDDRYLCRLRRLVPKSSLTSRELNWTKVRELQREQPHWSLHVLRTKRALTVIVALQPISTKSSRDADARDQWMHRVTGSICSAQFMCYEPALKPCWHRTNWTELDWIGYVDLWLGLAHSPASSLVTATYFVLKCRHTWGCASHSHAELGRIVLNTRIAMELLTLKFTTLQFVRCERSDWFARPQLQFSSFRERNLIHNSYADATKLLNPLSLHRYWQCELGIIHVCCV